LSTFYGGEQLINVVSVSGTFNNGVVVYTCPVGRYARVQVLFAGESLNVGSAFLNVNNLTPLEGRDTVTLTMTSGEQIVITTNSTGFTAKIFEYATP